MSCLSRISGYKNSSHLLVELPPRLSYGKLKRWIVTGAEKNPPLLIITGATGNIGRSVISEGRGKKYKIFAYTRYKKEKDDCLHCELIWDSIKGNLIELKGRFNHFIKHGKFPDRKAIDSIQKDLVGKVNIQDGLIWLKTSGNKPEDWFADERLKKGIEKADRILVVNAIGSATPKYRDGETLESINETPALAFASGLLETPLKGKKITFVNISSIAPSYLHIADQLSHERYNYARVRERVDEQLEKLFKGAVSLQNESFNFVSLRPGFVFTALDNQNCVDTQYAYSPEQLANMCVPSILGSGEQITQPVYIEDIVQAVFNATEIDWMNKYKSITINAVGSQKVTQKEMLDFFAELVGKKILLTFSVSYKFGNALAVFAPKGRLAPYAVAMLEDIERTKDNGFCEGDFRLLLKKEPQKMRDVYKKQDELFLASLPLFAHIGQIFMNTFFYKQKRGVFYRTVIKKEHVPAFFATMLKGIPSCLFSIKDLKEFKIIRIILKRNYSTHLFYSDVCKKFLMIWPFLDKQKFLQSRKKYLKDIK